jgi:RNA polymerase sigma-70 factor, ECF subfamily
MPQVLYRVTAQSIHIQKLGRWVQGCMIPDLEFTPDSVRDRRTRDDATAERLLDQLCEGDPNALAGLYDLYHRLAYSIAYRILKDSGEAQDMVQEVFLKVYRSAGTRISGKGSVRHWIMTIVYNSSLDRWRYLSLRKFYKSAPLDTISDSETSFSLDHSEILAIQQRLSSALALLSVSQQQTLRLYFSEGYSLQEIADRLSDSWPNVRNHFYRGLARLRRLITNEGAIDSVRREGE